MDYTLAVVARIVAAFLLFACFSRPSYGSGSTSSLPTDECANAFANFQLTKTSATSEVQKPWSIDSMKVREGYYIERFVRTLPKKKKANRITVILQKKQNGQTGSYEVAAVCLENQRDMDSQGGLINFYSEKDVSAPIYFVLNDGEDVTWPVSPNEAIYMAEYSDGDTPPEPNADDWLACYTKHVHKRAIGNFGGVVWFHTCKNITSTHQYEYVLRLYDVVNGVPCYKNKCLRTIDPQIIHQPR
jgi:hypothetical protein